MRDKASHIAKYLKYDGYQHGLTSMVYKFFDRSSCGAIKSRTMPNQVLAGDYTNHLTENLKRTRKNEIYIHL